MIEEREYTVDGFMSRDVYDTAIGACKSLASDYGGDFHLEELVMDVANRFTPIFRDDLVAVLFDLEFYIGQALDEGCVKTAPQEFNLLRLIQAGYCEFLEETMSENLSTIVFNHLVQIANENPSNEAQDYKIEEAIDGIVSTVEKDATFDSYEEKLRAAIIEITEAKSFA